MYDLTLLPIFVLKLSSALTSVAYIKMRLMIFVAPTMIPDQTAPNIVCKIGCKDTKIDGRADGNCREKVTHFDCLTFLHFLTCLCLTLLIG